MNDYWDTIEAALTALPESYPLRADALASFDHLKERVTSRRPPSSNEVEALRTLLGVAERMRGGDPSLDPEEWYLARDYARVTIAKTENV